jgi:Ca2+-binding RTX toxin-like protein
VSINLSTTSQQNTLGAGLDTLNSIENVIGSAQNDTLTGSTGANSLDGGNGNDFLSGLAGNDTLAGGSGLGDTVTYATATNGAGVVVTLAAGAATVLDAHAVGEIDTLSGIENIIGSNYNDSITGDTSDNSFEGGIGADTIHGGDGNDTITDASASLNFLVNGSFELPASPGTYSGGSTTLTGWTVTGLSIDHLGSGWQAADGTYLVDLSGTSGANSAGGLTQTIST